MEFITRQIRGVQLKLRNDNRSLDLCSRMNYETENLDLIDALEPGDVFYDLGACEGRFSIYAALKGLEVYAFEPEQRNFEAFQSNLALNPTEKVHPFHLGVGAENKEVSMLVGQPWEGGHQKVVENAFGRDDLSFDVKEKQRVKIRALDDFILQENLPIPKYMKVDVDGSEMDFVLGAPKTLGNPTLEKMLFELDKHDKYYTNILEKVLGHGFRVHREYAVPNEEHLFNIEFTRSNN